MKIAVLSTDGVTVAPSLAAARAVIVYETEGDRAERLELRPFGDGAFPEVAGEASLVKVLDCQLLIAGSITSAEEGQFRRLGILPLPVLSGEPAEVAVRFVLLGEAPKEGDACGTCPNRAEKERQAGPLPADRLVALGAEPAGQV